LLQHDWFYFSLFCLALLSFLSLPRLNGKVWQFGDEHRPVPSVDFMRLRLVGGRQASPSAVVRSLVFFGHQFPLVAFVSTSAFATLCTISRARITPSCSTTN
jgi:hypothetical protein